MDSTDSTCCYTCSDFACNATYTNVFAAVFLNFLKTFLHLLPIFLLRLLVPLLIYFSHLVPVTSPGSRVDLPPPSTLCQSRFICSHKWAFTSHWHSGCHGSDRSGRQPRMLMSDVGCQLQAPHLFVLLTWATLAPRHMDEEAHCSAAWRQRERWRTSAHTHAWLCVCVHLRDGCRLNEKINTRILDRGYGG